MRPAIRGKKKKSPRLRKSLCCSTTDTLVSYRGLNQSEIVKGGPPLWLAVVQILLYSCMCVCVWRCVCCCCQTEREVSSRDASSSFSESALFSERLTVSPGFCDRWIYRKIKQTPLFSKLPQILRLDASCDVIAMRIQSKKGWKSGMNSFVFSSCLIYKSCIGQTNRKRIESALLVWATDRLSARTGAVGCSRSRDTVIHSAGRYSE